MYEDWGAEWEKGQVVRLDENKWKETSLTPQGRIPESGVYLHHDGKLYVFKGQNANL